MPFVKLVKNKAYFKRYQTKYRRRREGKTDYYARQRLVVQAKNKYNTPRYRLVVRSSNKYLLAQIVYSEINCDKVIASAYSSELSRYGLKVGLKNYAAAYCTGLLVARRVLTKLGLNELYEGNSEVTGEVVSTNFNGRQHFVDEVDEDKRPFRAVLDVGLTATTVGNRVFGFLKGAVDGGLDIPHNEKNFPGYDADAKEFCAEVHRDHIFGDHVAEYMKLLQEQDAENGTEDYKRQFGNYIAEGVSADDLEDLYTAVHAAIRADPTPAFAESAKARKAAGNPKKNTAYANRAKMSLKQRKNRVAQKKAYAAAQAEE